VPTGLLFSILSSRGRPFGNVSLQNHRPTWTYEGDCYKVIWWRVPCYIANARWNTSNFKAQVLRRWQRNRIGISPTSFMRS